MGYNIVLIIHNDVILDGIDNLDNDSVFDNLVIRLIHRLVVALDIDKVYSDSFNKGVLNVVNKKVNCGDIEKLQVKVI